MTKNMKTIDIKGKPYIEVNERIKAFRSDERFKNYSLESDIVQLENGVCTIKAIIKDENGRIIATGYAQEKENSSFINKTSYIENCETSAWGRALGNLGIGIDTSIASAEEVLNAMANQLSNKTVIKQESMQIEVNPDLDILEGIKAVSDINNLEKYYRANKDKVKDITAYNKAVNKQKDLIMKGK